MTSFGRRIVSSTIWSAVEGWVREATVFAVFIILARLLGPEAIGLAALSMSVPYILMILVQHGLPQALIQRKDIEPIHLDSAFWLLLAIGALLTSIIYLSAPLLAFIFEKPILEDLIHLSSFSVVLASLSPVPTAVLSRKLQFRIFAIRTMMSAGAGVAIGLTLVFLGYGVWSIVVMYVARSAVEALILLVGGGWYPRLRYSHAKCRELFGFAGPVLTNVLLAVCSTEAPKVALGIFLGPAAVGLYALARRPVDLLINLLIVPIRHVILPVVSQFQTDPGRVDRFLSIGIQCAALITFPAFVGFAVIAPILIPAALGPEWRSAVEPIQILCIYGMQRALIDVFAETMLSLGHAGPYMRTQIVATVLTSVLIVPTAAWSVEGVTIAIVLCQFVVFRVLFSLLRDVAGIDPVRHLKLLPALILICGVMALAVTLWTRFMPGELSAVSQLGIGIAIGVVVFTGLASLILQNELLVLRDLLLAGRRKQADPEHLSAVGSK